MVLSNLLCLLLHRYLDIERAFSIQPVKILLQQSPKVYIRKPVTDPA